MVSHAELAALCLRSYDEHTACLNEVEFLVSTQKNCLVIAFRGTEASKWDEGRNWLDILRDVWIFPRRAKGAGWGHAGFLRGAEKVVNEYVLRNISSLTPIIVTGHSLGGGLAVCAAALLRAHGYNVKELVTFGAPKALARPKRYLEGVEVTQYVNKNDIVPQFMFWHFVRHYNWVQLGDKNSFLKRTWRDHWPELYVKAMAEIKDFEDSYKNYG